MSRIPTPEWSPKYSFSHQRNSFLSDIIDVDTHNSNRDNPVRQTKYGSTMSRVSVSPSFSFSSLQSKNHSTSFTRGFCSVNPRLSSLPDTNLKKQLGLRFWTPTRTPHGISVRCNSSTRPGGPVSGTIVASLIFSCVVVMLRILNRFLVDLASFLI